MPLKRNKLLLMGGVYRVMSVSAKNRLIWVNAMVVRKECQVKSKTGILMPTLPFCTLRRECAAIHTSSRNMRQKYQQDCPRNARMHFIFSIFFVITFWSVWWERPIFINFKPSKFLIDKNVRKIKALHETVINRSTKIMGNF